MSLAFLVQIAPLDLPQLPADDALVLGGDYDEERASAVVVAIYARLYSREIEC
jgi:hypothetical protein